MNLETLSIEQLADLRDQVIATINDRVSARQRELQSEIDRLGGVSYHPNPGNHLQRVPSGR
jgi:hypothetical protein